MSMWLEAIAMLLLRSIVAGGVVDYALAFSYYTTRISQPSSFTSTSLYLAASEEEPCSKHHHLPSPPTTRRDEDRFVYAGVSAQTSKSNNDDNVLLVNPPRALSDPYGWLNNQSSQEVLDHLEKENAHAQACCAKLTALQDVIYTEMVSSLQETDYTAPYVHGGYMYYSRTSKGKPYRCYCRAPRDDDDDEYSSNIRRTEVDANLPLFPGEMVLLDGNVLATEMEYCAISPSSMEISPSKELLAYAVDDSGDETYRLFVKNIKTGDIVFQSEDELEMSGEVIWGNDDTTLFFTTLDDIQRPYRLYKKVLGDGSRDYDELLYEETDERYYCSLSKSLDDKYLLLHVASKEESEVWYAPLDGGNLKCIAKRRENVIYNVKHGNGLWWIVSNVGGSVNNKLYNAPAKANCEKEWTVVTLLNDENNKKAPPLFDDREERSVERILAFVNHVVVEGREGGMPRIWVLALLRDGRTVQSMRMLEFDEAAHEARLAVNRQFDTKSIAVYYHSMITPLQVMEIPLEDGSAGTGLGQCPQRRVIKATNVPGYDKSLYACERTTVRSRDGKTAIPVSMVYRKDVMEKAGMGNRRVPTHVYGYGAYGACTEADFSALRLPLLDRGVVVVAAHVRGGGELGRSWYNGGRGLHKKNSFHDFVDVAQWLVNDRKVTTASMLSCEGSSAGGLLIGAAINEAPELFRVAMLSVPFVDVVNTMTDASIPLTATEWSEWGNPNEEKYIEYMLSYCPMHNVQKHKQYPSCWITAGLYDQRVPYWGPAKFAAMLRHRGDASVILNVDMGAGHFGASGRYAYLQDKAMGYSFLLDQLGMDGLSGE